MNQRICNIFFFIPFCYTYVTRLRTVPKAISMIIFYFVPVCILLHFQQLDISWPRLLLLAVFAILGVQTVYEIGYIQNDTETIKLEKHPTMRLSAQQLEFYGQYRVSIYVIRIMLACIFSFALCFLTGQDGICYSLGLIAILAVYQGYNRTRSYYTCRPLYFLLVSLRYVGPLLSSPCHLYWNLIIITLMIYPIPKTIMLYFEKDKKRYDNTKLANYRVIIYLLLLIVGYILFSIGYFHISYVYLIMYMLIYRLTLYVIIKYQSFTNKYL